MFVPSLRRSQLSWPGKRIEHVMPERPAETRWFKSPYVGVVSFRVLKPMLRLIVLITCPISSYEHSCSFQNVEPSVRERDLTGLQTALSKKEKLKVAEVTPKEECTQLKIK